MEPVNQHFIVQLLILKSKLVKELMLMKLHVIIIGIGTIKKVILRLCELKLIVFTRSSLTSKVLIWTTFASCKKSYINIINEAKKQGFITHLLYVGLDSPELAKNRVKARVVKGGHGIPDETIDRRYPKSLKNLTALAPFFDTVEVFDNTNEFTTIYIRNTDQILIHNKEISWAQESINADKLKLAERKHKRQ
jgi:predicted ABC-type ATPase